MSANNIPTKNELKRLNKRERNMTLRILSVAVLASAAILFAGCDAKSPASSSDNAVPPLETAATPLFNPLSQDSSKLPFPTDLVFASSENGNIAVSYDPGASNASVLKALNTSSGFSTTAMLTIPFSVPIDGSTENLTKGIRIFQVKGSGRSGNFILASVAGQLQAVATNPGTPAPVASAAASLAALYAQNKPSGIANELTYGIDFVASASGNTVAILPLKPLESATSYIIVVTKSLKTVTGESVSSPAQYIDARNDVLGIKALNSKVEVQETLVKAYSAANPFAPTVLKAAASGDPSLAQPVPLTASNIALSYSVTTQNIEAPIKQAQSQITAPSIQLAPVDALTAIGQAISAASTSGNTQLITKLTKAKLGLACLLSDPTDCLGQNPASWTPSPLADVYIGKVAGMVSFLDPNDPANSTWQGTNRTNPNDHSLNAINLYKADPQGTVDVPVIVTVPSAASGCAAPYPVTIYQHGITSNRVTLLALARSLAGACQVGVAIDLPEHGLYVNPDSELSGLAIAVSNIINQATSGGYAADERLVTRGAAAGGACMQGAKVTAADGREVCASGDSYINLFNLANARDVLRQSVIDLDSLYLALQNSSTLVSTMSGSVQIDTANINFVGMSLGAIVGETFAATLSNISGNLQHIVFNVGGGGIAKLLDGSASFEPVITQGLAAKGVTKPSASYTSFLIAAQTLVDSADPINYTDQLASIKTKILFQEVVGDGSTQPDLVVPNNVFGPATSELGEAWSAVSGSLVQANVSATQSPSTLPAAFGGTDSLTQGTGFVALASVLAANPSGVSACVTAYGPLCPAISQATGGAVVPFTGIGLPQVSESGMVMVAPSTTPSPATYGLVRFSGGAHSSLLDPSASLDITTMMQTQVAAYLSTGFVVGESACTTCSGSTIAAW